MLRIVSDIHAEFFGDYKSHVTNNGRDWNHLTVIPKMPDVDEKEQTLILAGDIVTINNIDKYQPFFDDLSNRFKDIILVMGNHEFYNSDYDAAVTDYYTFLSQWNNIVLLENEAILYNGTTLIYGGTMWTDFDKNSLSKQYISMGMNDFRIVYKDNRLFHPDDAEKVYNQFMSGLESWLEKVDNIIVVSHHAPSKESSLDIYKGSPLNPAFCANLEEFIIENSDKIKFWFHGHVHNKNDYMIGNTRVISNPRGYDYPNENPYYDPFLTVDI